MNKNLIKKITLGLLFPAMFSLNVNASDSYRASGFDRLKRRPVLRAKDREKLNFSLIRAAEYGSLMEIEQLLNSGADVNAQNNKGETALMLACRKIGKKTAKLLLNRGADVNLQAKDGRTALMEACSIGVIELVQGLVQLLIQAGANIDMQDNNGETALDKACGRSDWDIVELLIKNNAVLSERGRMELDYPLIQAVKYGNLTEVKRFLNFGANVNARNNFWEWDGKGPTALMEACRHDRKEIAELLLKKGADTSARDVDGETALDTACWREDWDIVELLVKNNAVLSEKGQKQLDNRLLMAIGCGNLTEVERLLNFGANVNAQDMVGKTALMYSRENGYKEITDLLISKGAKEQKSSLSFGSRFKNWLYSNRK